MSPQGSSYILISYVPVGKTKLVALHHIRAPRFTTLNIFMELEKSSKPTSEFTGELQAMSLEGKSIEVLIRKRLSGVLPASRKP